MGSSKKITVVITGGGTGGHIYPAVAVAQKLKNDEQVERLVYIGCPNNLEKDIAQRENLEFLPIEISGMPRKIGFGLVKWVFALAGAVKQSMFHLKAVKPDVILGTGGYVSGAVLIAAHLLKIPFVIHDPDAHPGIVNRCMSSKAELVTVAFEQAKNYLKAKNIILNGNPLRSNFNNVPKDEAAASLNLDPEKRTILVMGGSQGAKTINDAVLNSAKSLIIEHGFQIIHQTGKKNFEEYIQKISNIWPDYRLNSSYVVKPYFDEMALPLAAADLAISRAGSLSISELNLNSLPSILVPYPYAAADHQRFNAKALEKAGASLYLEDSDCNSDNLVKLILNLFDNPDKLQEMKSVNKSLAKFDATDNLVEIIKGIAG